MLRSLTFGALLLASVSASQPAMAQDDLRLRTEAFEVCDTPGWLGYGSYEICVEAIYQDLLYQPQIAWQRIYTYTGQSYPRDPGQCNTAETRICNGLQN